MKKIKDRVVLFVVAVISLSSSSMVNAVNYVDGVFTHYKIMGESGAGHMKKLCDVRHKEDTSSVYFYVTNSSDRDVWMWVQF